MEKVFCVRPTSRPPSRIRLVKEELQRRDDAGEQKCCDCGRPYDGSEWRIVHAGLAIEEIGVRCPECQVQGDKRGRA